MRLSVIAVALSAALLWGGAVFLVGLINAVAPPYGGAFLQLVASLYPGFHPGQGFGSVLIGTLWGLADGAIGGALFAWLYNLFARRFARERA